MPPFPVWIKTAISNAIKDGEEIDKDTLHMSMPPTLPTRSYHLIYALEKHIKVLSVEEHLKTLDSGVVATFEDECISKPNDQILELNYEILKVVVLLCNWVNINYSRNNVTMKKSKYDLKLVILDPNSPNSHFRSVFYFPIACRASFLFL
jgi:hypothetical protein